MGNVGLQPYLHVRSINHWCCHVQQGTTLFYGHGITGHFLDQALGSANEVETQLLISKNLNYITEENYQILILKLTSIQKQLTGLIANIRQQSGSR